ncbi:hypothetical protein ABFX02_08G138100 [Erythranthe guttata]
MAKSLILLPAIFLSVFVFLAESNALSSPIGGETTSSCSEQGKGKSLACQVEEAKLEISRLESILEERIGDMNAKTRHFEDCEKKIEDLATVIDLLVTDFSRFENDSSRASEKLTDLEDEVRLLWAASRKNNFEIYEMELKALGAERRLREVTSQVGEMSEIVSEQWIQIQQLEQAVHMAEIRASKVRKKLWKRCPFVKSIIAYLSDCLKTLKRILDPYVSRYASLLVSCNSQALQMFASAKGYHHQLQDLIRYAMQNNELTAVLAHEEVVFFVASALVAFPLMTACMLLLSQFS